MHNVWKCAKSFQTPTSSCQHTNVNIISSHHHHHCRHWAPWLMPTSEPIQGRLNDLGSAQMLTPPFHHLSTYHIITSNPSKHNAWQPHVGKAKGDWRGWIKGGEGAGGGVMTTRQHKTHMLHQENALVSRMSWDCPGCVRDTKTSKMQSYWSCSQSKVKNVDFFETSWEHPGTSWATLRFVFGSR